MQYAYKGDGRSLLVCVGSRSEKLRCSGGMIVWSCLNCFVRLLDHYYCHYVDVGIHFNVKFVCVTTVK